MAKETREADTVFRIQRPDGSFRGSGHEGGKGRGQRKAKTWEKSSHVKNHLKLAGHYSDGPEEIVRKADAEGSVVVEYRLVEVGRTPVVDFLREES